MRRSLSILALVAAFGPLAGCDSMLQEEPHSFITKETFYKTAGDANAAVLGIYGSLTHFDAYGRWAQTLMVHPTGAVNTPKGWTEYQLAWDGSYSQGATVWASHYQIINRANMVLKYVPKIEMDEQRKQELLGEAHFLRALAYFNLVRWFGGVPLHTEPTEDLSGLSKERATLAETYDLIVEDLKFAEEHLPAKGMTAPERADKGSAKGLLAKVYLTMAGQPLNDDSKLPLARQKLLELVDPANCAVGKMGHALQPDFADLWWKVEKPRVVSEPAVENGPESVFEINYDLVDGTRGAIFPQARNAVRVAQFEPWVIDLFEENDYRLERSMGTRRQVPGKGEFQIKYPWTGTTAGNHANNWPYMRFTDVMLMFAEVENKLNGPTEAALDCVNALRERARQADGEPRSVPADLTLAEVGSQEQFDQIIFDERIREMVLEGHLWFDMQRTGRIQEMVEAQGRSYSPRIELFAIPQNEIDLTKGVLTQNPGY